MCLTLGLSALSSQFFCLKKGGSTPPPHQPLKNPINFHPAFISTRTQYKELKHFKDPVMVVVIFVSFVMLILLFPFTIYIP